MFKRRARRAWASATVMVGFVDAVGGFAMAEMFLNCCEVVFWVCGLVFLGDERVAEAPGSQVPAA